MKVDIVNKKGEKVKQIELDKSLEVSYSPSALALYVNYLRNACRGSVAKTKDRSEVSGGGKKPYKQKGTGRARAGSSRSPLWVGGGVTFGPTGNENHKTRINKQTKKKIILGTIGSFFKNKRAVLVEDLIFGTAKTKEAVDCLKKFNIDGKIALIFDQNDTNAEKSFRNIAGIEAMPYNKLDFLNLLSANSMVLSLPALENIVNTYKLKETK